MHICIYTKHSGGKAQPVLNTGSVMEGCFSGTEQIDCLRTKHVFSPKLMKIRKQAQISRIAKTTKDNTTRSTKTTQNEQPNSIYLKAKPSTQQDRQANTQTNKR